MVLFESSVNSEGIETEIGLETVGLWFESSVNSEGIETQLMKINTQMSLRAV